ncbi:MAG: DNA mismatch repair protein MutL, partial [Nitrospinaceae bacterium]|nr:DNA mismatch repair protein MutL [Nitrospinaceae bacterium]
PVIAYAVREAYRNSLPRDRHPSLVLLVALPPGDVDVNVHPTKREVRFRHSGQVRDAVVDALTQALAGG